MPAANKVTRWKPKARAAATSYFPDASADDNVAFIKSGCTTLDLALGGGWAMPRVINIVGDKSTGKTLLCIEAAANFIRQFPNGRVRYRESEAAFQTNYAEALGMPIEQVDFGEGRLDTVEDLVEELEHRAAQYQASRPELIIVDSLDALSSRAELKRGIDDASYGGDKAKKLSELFRRLVRSVEASNITLIIVSQIRDNINARFARKHTRSGGHALDFYASQIVWLAYLGQVHRTVNGIKMPVGITVKAKVDKNKVGLPFRESQFNIIFGYGVDDNNACLEYLKQVGSLKQALNGQKESAFVKGLERDPAQARRMRELVAKRWGEIERSFMPKRRKYGEDTA